MKTILATAALSLILGSSLPAFAQADAPTWNSWRYRATATRTSADGPRKHRKVYYGVGFGQHHRTTATGGNPGGYSDRN